MNKKIIHFLLCGTLILLTTVSCEDVIDVDLHSVTPQLVIEGTVRLNEQAEVVITQTQDFGSVNKYPPVTDAQVVISDDAGNTETLRCNEAGKYVASGIVGVERRTYRLSVVYKGVEYTSVSRMPPLVELDALTLYKLPVKDYPDPMVHFVDPVGEENQYYRYVISVNGVRPTEGRLEDRLISTEFMDGSMVSFPIFVNYEDHRDKDPYEKGDMITVEMQCLDKGTYTFFETLGRLEQSLANPTSNIEGGALGYFGAYSFSKKDIVAEW